MGLSVLSAIIFDKMGFKSYFVGMYHSRKDIFKKATRQFCLFVCLFVSNKKNYKCVMDADCTDHKDSFLIYKTILNPIIVGRQSLCQNLPKISLTWSFKMMKLGKMNLRSNHRLLIWFQWLKFFKIEKLVNSKHQA